MDSQAIITSAGVAVIIAGGFNWFFKEVDYSYDYKKYILKRRQEAYLQVERIVIQLNRIVFDPGYPGKKVHEIFYADKSRDPLNDFLTNDLAKVMESRLWLTHEMLLHLASLNKTLLIIAHEDPTPDPAPDSLFQKGIKFSQEIDVLIMQLQLQLFKDIRSMESIRRFKKNSFFR